MKWESRLRPATSHKSKSKIYSDIIALDCEYSMKFFIEFIEIGHPP